MAKRFTDSNKWDHSWFRKISPKMKCAWAYLLDKCDNAGVWVVDFEAMSFHIGEHIGVDEFESVFLDKIKWVNKDKIFVLGYIEFQYGTLSDECKPHRPVIEKLKKLNLLKGYSKGFETLEEKDKEKDKEKEQEKDKEKNKEKETKFNFEAMYKKYPVRTKGSHAEQRFADQIKTEQDFADLSLSLDNYLAFLSDPKNQWRQPKQSFETFLGTKSSGYFWRDWIDPSAGKSMIGPKPIEEQDFSDIFDKKETA